MNRSAKNVQTRTVIRDSRAQVITTINATKTAAATPIKVFGFSVNALVIAEEQSANEMLIKSVVPMSSIYVLLNSFSYPRGSGF